MKILAVYADSRGCGWYRMFSPMHHIRALGHTVTMCNITEAPAHVHDEDVCFVQRQFLPYGLHLIQEKRAHGIPVVAELDDNMWTLPAFNDATATWGTNVVVAKEQALRAEGKMPPGEILARPKTLLAEFLRMADAVSVTEEPLRQAVRKFNANVYVLPNYIEDSFMSPWPRPAQFLGTLRIAWTGSASHVRDLQPLAIAMLRLCKEFRHVKFIQIGPFQDMMEDFPSEQVEFYPPFGWVDEFLRLTAFTPYHIGVAPLEHTEFNKTKSSIKALEYGWNGALAVCQRWAPYQALPELGTLVPEVKKFSAEAWYQALRPYAIEPEKVPALAALWQERVRRDYSMSTQVWRYERMFEQVIERYAEVKHRNRYVPMRFPSLPTKITRTEQKRDTSVWGPRGKKEIAP